MLARLMTFPNVLITSHQELLRKPHRTIADNPWQCRRIHHSGEAMINQVRIEGAAGWERLRSRAN